MVVHHSLNFKCHPLDPTTYTDRDRCAPSATVRHNCKYYGKPTVHKSCHDIKRAWTGASPPEDGSYFVELGGGFKGGASHMPKKTVGVFCAFGADANGHYAHHEVAETYASCSQCAMVGGVLLCAEASCCPGQDMREVPFDRMEESARLHFSEVHAAGTHRFCTTDAASDEPADFVDRNEAGFSDCKCCECLW
jgi:hypothetical protein